MARQSTTPVQFGKTKRKDDGVVMSSARAGVVVPVLYAPLLRGDSASGRVGIDIDLAEMPKPLMNGVICNVQAWFVPKSAHPQFSGIDEFMHSYQGEAITALGQPDRQPPPFFNTIDDPTTLATLAGSDFYKKMGIHLVPAQKTNTDLMDAFSLIYNFRLASHSSRLPRRSYATEDILEASSLPRAFWPTGRFSGVVPDYERALVLGALDLDVTSGSIPLDGLGYVGPTPIVENDVSVTQRNVTDTGNRTVVYEKSINMGGDLSHLQMQTRPGGLPAVYAEMRDQQIGVTLADIEKARTTQAFAKLRTAYAGNDATGFDNDDVLVAELMQGFRVPDEMFKRPWLLDSARVPFGMIERHATDAANLDQSVSRGRASTQLSINVPANDVGGLIIVTAEVLPERIDERQSDEWLHMTYTSSLPDALRDVQRAEPVDMVINRRLDAKHTNGEALYGYEPMNNIWNRSHTRLGGDFFQADPLAPVEESRAAIWHPAVVDPEFTADHFLAPDDFPHTVFAVTDGDAFEIVARHDLTIVGLTQIGDVLAENNDDYAALDFDEEPLP